MVVMYRGVLYDPPYDPPEVHSLVERIAELEKERDIRDLEQQAIGIEDVVNECAHSREAIQVYVADLDCRVADLREQAKAIKEQKSDG